MENQKQRPLVVTIIAILMTIGGIIYLSAGAILVLFGIGVVLVPLGIAYFVMCYGLWKGKRWAWNLTLILSVIGIILSIASIAVGDGRGALIHIILNALAIYYLFGRNVKEFFGKT
jgi:uncharacterized membrane protein (DUF2068 family)